MRLSRLLLVLLALSSVACLESVLATVRSAGSHERQADALSTRITEAGRKTVGLLGLGKCTAQEARLVGDQLTGARTLVDRSALGLTTSILGLGRQSRVTGDLRTADSTLDSVEKLLRVWETRPGDDVIPVPPS